MKLPDLVDHLRGLADKGMALGPLLALLLPHLGASILDKKLYAKAALSMVKTLPLGQSYSQKHACAQLKCLQIMHTSFAWLWASINSAD